MPIYSPVHRNWSSLHYGRWPCRCLSKLALALLAPLTLWLPTVARAHDSLLSEDAYLDDLPIVLSASRLPQPVENAPIATTIIDRQMIVASGFTEIPDLLRLAPGFIVDYYNGYTQAVGYHVLADRFSRRMQVLVDGRSVYEPGLGGVPWSALALTIDDIERIEVVRGPNAASYGANAFTSVVNIITRHAVLDRGLNLKTNVGTDGLAEGFVRYGGDFKRLDYRVGAAYRENDGFDHRHDFQEVTLLNLRGDYEIDMDNTLMVQLGHTNGPRGADNVFDELIPDHTAKVYSQFQQLKWTHTSSVDNEFHVQLYHNQYKNINDYTTTPITALGGLQVYVDERLTTDRYDAEFQHILKPAQHLRLVWGLGARKDEVQAPIFFNTTHSLDNKSYRIFSNAEYRLGSRTILNGGVMYEDSDTGGDHISPRASINYHFLPNHTLRLSASRAYRDPFLFEQSPDYHLPVPVPNNVLVFDAGDVDSEEITSYEIGYIGHFAGIHTTLDAKYFHNELDNLITYDDTVFPLGLDGTALFLSNFDNARIQGIELSANYQPGDGNRLTIGYTHQDINATDRTNNARYEDGGPSDILSLLAIHDFGRGYSASAGYYYLSDIKELESRDVRPDQKRVDVRLARNLSTGGQRYTLALAVQNLFDDQQDTRLENSIERRIYGSIAVKFK